MIPFRLKSAFKLYFKGRFLTKNDRKVVAYLARKNVKNAVVMSGYRKSGNNWFNFILYNYFNILSNGAEETLTFEGLNELNCGNLEGGVTSEPAAGFPHYYYTHEPYRRIFDYFYKRIFLYRNPLDAFVSYYFNQKARIPAFSDFPSFERKRLHDIDYFVKFNMPLWMYHYKSNIGRADAVVCYEKMKKDTFEEISTAFRIAGFRIEEDALKKSIAMSSFDNIKQMAKEKNQLYGSSNPRNFKGEFMRSGKVGEYKDILKPATIAKAQDMLQRNFIDFCSFTRRVKP
jgi:hypothetical protein